MAGAPTAATSGRHEMVTELRMEAVTMALYVAICLLAAVIALPRASVHPRVLGIIWGVTLASLLPTGSPSGYQPVW